MKCMMIFGVKIEITRKKVWLLLRLVMPPDEDCPTKMASTKAFFEKHCRLLTPIITFDPKGLLCT